MAAVAQNFSALIYASEELKMDVEVLTMQAVAENGLELENAS